MVTKRAAAKKKKEPSAFAVAFGSRLRSAREAKSLTGEALGLQVAKTKHDVSHWENAVHMPDLEVFAALCDALGCSADDLLGRGHRALSASALAEARAFDGLPPEMQKKWRTMRLTLFATA
jgi:transcriptional regulator with XRE-family HTH domain